VLSPFHDFASTIPAALQAELKQVQAGVESGSIQTPTKSRCKARRQGTAGVAAVRRTRIAATPAHGTLT